MRKNRQNPRILVVTPEITYLPEGMGNYSHYLHAKAGGMADITICVPEDETFKIQEYHLPVYHMLCIAAENEFFGE